MAAPYEVPNKPADTVFCISSSVVINSPAADVFSAITNTETWPEWNSFVPSADIFRPSPNEDSPRHGTLQVGAQVMLHVRMTPTSSLRDQKEEICEVTVPKDVEGSGNAKPGDVFRASWKAEGFPTVGLRCLRVNEVHVIDDSSCEYRTWEMMAGPTAYIVKRMYAKTLQERFIDWANDLKSYAERGQEVKKLNRQSRSRSSCQSLRGLSTRW